MSVPRRASVMRGTYQRDVADGSGRVWVTIPGLFGVGQQVAALKATPSILSPGDPVIVSQLGLDKDQFVVTGAVGVTNPPSTSLPTPNTLMLRDASGRSQVADPSAAQDIATKNYVDIEPLRYLYGGVKTTAFAAVVGTFYAVNLPSSAGTVNITLPTTPAQGSVIAFARIDNNLLTSNASIVRGGGDTIEGATTFSLFTSVSVTLLYSGTTWRVIAMGFPAASGLLGPSTVAGFGNNMMARDSSGRSQVADPAATQDIATKHYVDLAMPTGVILPYAAEGTPSGWLPCDGSAVSRTTYVNLFNTIMFSMLMSYSSGSNIIAVTATLAQHVGKFVEGPNIPLGTTIASILDSTHYLFSNSVTGTQSSVSVKISPWGFGDGSTTFNVPDLRGRVLAGWDATQAAYRPLGKISGNATHNHGSAAHSHPLSNAAGAQIFVGNTGIFGASGGPGGWSVTRALTTTTAASSGVQGASSGLVGNTDSIAPGTTDLASGLDPYSVLNYIVKT